MYVVYSHRIADALITMQVHLKSTNLESHLFKKGMTVLTEEMSVTKVVTDANPQIMS